MKKNIKNDWRDWLINLLGLQPEDRMALMAMLQKLKRESNFISAEEMRMIEGVLRMREGKIRDAMIGFGDVAVMKITDDYAQAVAVVREWQHSRYPVVDGDGKIVLGILLAKDLLEFADKPDAFNMKNVMREPIFEPDSKPLNQLLEDFRSFRSHMVIVRDEYTDTVGIVTIEDLLERIVGEIEDESDDAEDRDITPRADGAAEIKGSLSVEEFNLHFDSRLPPNGADTIAGWLAAALGHLPAAGERHEIPPFIFEILEADDRRIHRLTVRLQRE